MVIWNADRLDALREAMEDAVRARETTFIVDLDKKLKGCAFTVEEAIETLASVEPTVKRVPPVYPENKEGTEP